MRLSVYVVFSGSLLLLAAAAPAYTVPQNIPVQGRLTNASTGVVLSGEYTFTFRIYNASSGGTLLWDENQTLTVDGNGLWNALLGNNTSLSLNFSEDTYLEVELNHDGSPLPRVQLGSTPYAEWTDTAANLSCTDCLGTTEIEDIYLLNSGDNATGNYMFNGSFKVENSTGSAVLYVNESNGSVGIGTASPNSKLDVLTNSMGNQSMVSLSSNGGWSIQPGINNQLAIQWRDNTDVTASIGAAFDGTSVNLYFGRLYNSGYKSWSDTLMTIKGSGNVGIGTTSPSAKLDVEGNIDISDYNITDVAFISGGGDAVKFADDLNLSTNTLRFSDPTYNSSISLGGTSAGTNKPALAINVQPADSVNENAAVRVFRSGDVKDYAEFVVVEPNVGTVRFRLRSYKAGQGTSYLGLENATDLYVDGKVGIGTTSPGATLDIGGYDLYNYNPNLQFSVNSDNANIVLQGGQYSEQNNVTLDLIGGRGDNGYRYAIRLKGVRTASIGNGARLDFLPISRANPPTEGSVIMSLLDSGYVGIGTTSPGYTLEVNGSALISGARPVTIAPSNGNIRIKGSSAGWAYSYGATGNSDTDLGGYGFYGSGDTLVYYWIGNNYTSPYMVIKSGNVGIGTTDPNDALDVVGDIDATGCVQTDDSGSIGGTCISDLRFKTNIRPLEGSLDRISQLNPVSFEWDSEYYAVSLEKGMGVGLIAQELEEVYPELVVTDEDGYKRVRYDIELEMHLIQAVKELKEENEDLKRAICKIDPEAVFCAGL